jgi:hypothetical protein
MNVYKAVVIITYMARLIHKWKWAATAALKTSGQSFYARRMYVAEFEVGVGSKRTHSLVRVELFPDDMT